MNKNKIISLMLALSTMLLTVPAYAETDFSVQNSQIAEISETPPNGDVPYEIMVEGVGMVTLDDITSSMPALMSYNNLPSQFDAVSEGWVTPVKNQNPYGTCWAFSTISAMETNMIKKGYENVKNTDFSELHLAYFTHKRNEAFGDGSDSYTSELGYYGGGNTFSAAQHLAGWQGTAEEKSYPYPPESISYTLPEDDRYTSSAHLQNYIIIGKNSDAVKSAIMEYGSVTASYFDNDLYSSKHAYYQTAATATNHSITIVGWDDNYAVSNFAGLSALPQNPGAWKVKNSWGTTWGDNGYFWISYEEPTLSNFAAYDMEKSDNYQIMHQYDGAGFKQNASAEKAANIFTAEKNEVVKAVGFYTVYPAVEYKISVYKLSSFGKAPEDGTPISSVSGFLANSGYFTVKLKDVVPVKKDERFSVVISLSNNCFSFEGDNHSSNAGESFVYNGSWLDASGRKIGSTPLNNACIKAYASEENITVTYDTNGGTALSDTEVPKNSTLDIPSPPQKEDFYFAGWYKDSALTEEWNFETDMASDNITLYAKWSDSPVLVSSITLSSFDAGVLTGEQMQISAEVSPYYASNKALIWTSSSSGAEVSDGTVTGIEKGEYTITAAASDGSGVFAEYTVNVYNPMGNIALGMKKSVYKTTEQIYYYMQGENVQSFCLHIITPENTNIVSNPINNVPGKIIAISYSSYLYSEGKYTIYITATDPLGNVKSTSTQSFYVKDAKTLAAKKTNSGYIVTGYPEQTATIAEGIIIAAYYKDGKLIKTESKDNGLNLETSPQFTNIPDDVSVKFMWWNSTLNIVPLSTSINITKPNDETLGDVITAE